MMIWRRITALPAILLIASAAALRAQELRDDPRVRDAGYLLDQWISAQRDYERIPGMSMAVVHDQEVVWMEGYGYSNLERSTPTTLETVYSVCSISKLFTSIAAMQLRDEGSLRLDDRVDVLLPWFQLAGADTIGPALTVEALMTHASGLPNGIGHSELAPRYPTTSTPAWLSCAETCTPVSTRGEGGWNLPPDRDATCTGLATQPTL